MSPRRGGARNVRVNAFRQRGSVWLVMRAIPHEVKTVEELQLPPVIGELADVERGIILVTGTTGSGKSTTLAAMIDRTNASQPKHIVTIEDPIEFLHRDKRSIMASARSGEDTGSFKRALRRALRQDPDVILVGRCATRDRRHRALGGRNRPPGALDPPRPRRAGDDQPDHRLLPAPHARPRARHARRHA